MPKLRCSSHPHIPAIYWCLNSIHWTKSLLHQLPSTSDIISCHGTAPLPLWPNARSTVILFYPPDLPAIPNSFTYTQTIILSSLSARHSHHFHFISKLFNLRLFAFFSPISLPHSLHNYLLVYCFFTIHSSYYPRTHISQPLTLCSLLSPFATFLILRLLEMMLITLHITSLHDNVWIKVSNSWGDIDEHDSDK